jgi:hypothetical protein
MQLIVPASFVGYFLHQGDRHAASVAFWWIAQNLWNVSVYVSDARAQELPCCGASPPPAPTGPSPEAAPRP